MFMHTTNLFPIWKIPVDITEAMNVLLYEDCKYCNKQRGPLFLLLLLKTRLIVCHFYAGKDACKIEQE